MSKLGNEVDLEPIGASTFDVAAWRTRLDALGAADFFPDGPPDDPPIRADHSIQEREGAERAATVAHRPAPCLTNMLAIRYLPIDRYSRPEGSG